MSYFFENMGKTDVTPKNRPSANFALRRYGKPWNCK